MSERALVVFVTGGRVCALPTSVVREVVHYPELATPPGLPQMLDGFLNYGGEVLPVLRLDRLFGLPAMQPSLYSPVLILRETVERLALAVQEVRSVCRVEAAALLPVQDGSVFNDCLEAQFNLGDETVHVLTAEQLLLRQERERLRELGEMVERRLTELDSSA